ncbi:MAG: hypothetical protein OHK0048_09140 [Rhodoferax sp.]
MAFVSRWLLALVLALFTRISAAWTPGLAEAAQAVAAGSATPAQELAVFIHNRELNLMAQEGRLPERIYAVCQDEFFRLNNQLVQQAASRGGYGVSISDAKLNPGTDTDVNVLSKSGKPLRIEDIQKIEGEYQAALREHFLSKDPKLDIPKQRIDTNTDFMPHPDHTPPGEFRDIANHVNANGGTAYTDPRAASAQAKLGSTKPMTLDEANAFGNTMKDMANAKIQKAAELRGQAQNLRGVDPGKAEMLEAQAAQYEYQAAKYHDRLTQLDDHLRRQFKLPERPPGGAVDNAAQRIAKIGRNPYSRSELGTIRSLHENALQRSTDDLIDTLLKAARKDPSRLTEVQRIVREQARTLPMSRAGQAMERLQDTVKKIEAASKWTAFKNAAHDLSGLKQMTKVSVVMTAGGALLMGHEGVQAALKDVKATDTVWDFIKNVYLHAGWEGTGIGPAFERAQAEELARYLKEFENGADPSMVKHVTFTILKTGVYMGQDVLIGVLYLPDSIWEYLTQEKELEAYAAYNNELARVMRQMVLDRRDFENLMTKFRKLGLHDEDKLAFLNCLCRECGGSLGGLYNPGFKGEYGHGPCQCNGPLTIWKTPLPVGDSKVQYACFNSITKMRYDQAQDIFDQWHAQAMQANADSVAQEFKEIEDLIRANKVADSEDVARDVADKIAAISALLKPQDLDNLRAYVGPHLASHAAKTIASGRIDRAIDDVDRVLNKIGTRHPHEKSNLEATRALYERWAKAWKETQEKEFPEIDKLLGKNQVHSARSQLDALEYRMMKAQPRLLPYADQDPRYVALKKRVLDQNKAYQDALQAAFATAKTHQQAHDPRGAIPDLQAVLTNWEHPADTARGLQAQIAFYQGEVAKANALVKQGQDAEAHKDLGAAIGHYKSSLDIQVDEGVRRHLAQLQGELAEQQRRMAQAKLLRDQGAMLQQQNQIPQAIGKYRESLALVPDPALEAHIRALQAQWDAQQAQAQRMAQAKRLRDEGAALQQQNQIPQAIGKYRESLALVPDPALEAHIRALQASLAPKPTPNPTTPVATPVPPPGAAGSVLFDNGNLGAVHNKPTQATRVRFASNVTITKLTTYHWNNGRGTPSTGSIGLRDASGRLYGPWPTKGSPGQGNVTNAYWNAYPNVSLPAGEYTVEDSDPSTWAQNSGSKGAGHTHIEGHGSAGTAILGGGAGSSATPSPATQYPDQPNASRHDGQYQGRFSGQGQGTLVFTIRGNTVNGTLKGQVDGDPVDAQVQGQVDGSGQLRVTLRGTVHWTLRGSTSRGDTPFVGELMGTVRDGRVNGQWKAHSTDGEDHRSGSWQASR